MGPNFPAWMEFLQSALARAGLTGKRLNAATWAPYNHVMGATATGSSLRLSAEEARLGQEYRESRRDQYPTVAANNYISDVDRDTGFTDGLELLLDGIEAQTGS